LTIDDLKVNKPLRPDQFVLNQPAGTQVVDVDTTPVGLTAGGGTKNPSDAPRPKPEP